MTKVIRTTPIDRSKRTAVKGDVVDEINIIHGKRKRKLSLNFSDLISSEVVSKPKSSPKQTKTKKKQKELSDSEADEENPVIYLNTGKSKFEVVDMFDDESKDNETTEEENLFSQEVVEDQSSKKKTKKYNKKSTKRTKETSSKKKEKKPIFVEELPPQKHSELPFEPLQYFSKNIVEHVKKLGGTFPTTYNRNHPFIYGDRTYERFDESLRLFTCIQWNNHLYKSTISSAIFGLEFLLFVMDEQDMTHYDFIQDRNSEIALIGDATDTIIAADVLPTVPCSSSEKGDFLLYLIFDDQKHAAPKGVYLSTFLESLSIDTTEYSETDRDNFTQN
ncbi:hypothetical protein C9374_010220 [Naegleria lovaniensis]|uniref:Uncharacterized protein n=1 Tax=Naegleria lovaniensis TaxID=51637 RepID=A0AA88KDS8_NAELO|nr:uncharacterized protein C9374_012806 [Naegleria lovaniensis]XP_044544020.1 uncharacterized protein C9374_010220 [Naegleria lovaniensis]KAG2373204.1 hypothetical protein C9374_012806 [Naegleria lovaniensis]KAG2374846.1 hypothetical protein C9374_010220 [Naegleria lovaniensis]